VTVRRRLVLALLAVAAGALAPASAAHAAYAPLDRAGPALDVPAAQLDASLECSAGVAGATREPVLLSPATGVTADQNYSWNYESAFTARGIPWCQVTMPQRTLGDIQVAAEYLVNAIRTMHARSGRRIAVMGHSQGGMSMRWALRFWPDTRPMGDDVIGFAGSNHGTTAGGDCSNGCTPASWQQGAKSNFIAALNSLAETQPGISYTEIYTHTDEVVQPNANDNGSSSVHGGGGRITNVATQDICPTDVNEHLNIGTIDPVAYALAIDALEHDGPASPARIDPSVCTQTYQPGVDPSNAATYEQILAGAPGLAAVASPVNVVGVPTPKTEPALRCYVFAECTASTGGSDRGARCVTAAAKARGTVYGPAALARSRTTLRKRLPGRRGKRRPGIDRFCVAGGGALEIGYPTVKISRAGRRAAKGRSILVLASSSRFSVRGITHGTRTSTLRRRLHGERRYRVGVNTWYVARGAKATLVFRARHGRVGATGLASKRLTHGAAATRRLLKAWEFAGRTA
jgi:hypothetical protein